MVTLSDYGDAVFLFGLDVPPSIFLFLGMRRCQHNIGPIISGFAVRELKRVDAPRQVIDGVDFLKLFGFFLEFIQINLAIIRTRCKEITVVNISS